jgi:hypothetical protein
VKEGFVDLERAVVADYEMAKVSQPRIGSLNLPAFSVAPEGSSILSRLAHSVCLVWHDQLNAPLLQALPQRVAVIGLVGNQPLRLLTRTTAAAAVGDAD